MPERIPAILAAAEDLRQTSENLLNLFERQAHQIRWNRLLLGIAIGFLVVQVIFDGISAVTLSHRSDAVNAVRDCTTPAGRCYQRSQQSTADALISIERADIAIAVCARNPANNQEALMLSCVQRFTK